MHPKQRDRKNKVPGEEAAEDVRKSVSLSPEAKSKVKVVRKEKRGGV